MNIAIIQARMQSTRLPGKVLMKINGQYLLKYMVNRVNKSSLINKVVIATSTNKQDDKIANFCIDNNILFFRGSENDVLDRYYNAAKLFNAETVIRLTADCPLIDPYIIDDTISLFESSKVDYAANTVPPETKKYPDGSDVEVFSFNALNRAWSETKDKKDREHVTFYFWKRNKNFTNVTLGNKYDWGKYRITIDYIEDFHLVEKIITKLNEEKKFGTTKEIIEILEHNPKIFKLNSMHTWGANW